MTTSIKHLNTFSVDCAVNALAPIQTVQDLVDVQNEFSSVFILGGGSNVLFLDQAPEAIALMNNQGVSYEDKGDSIIVTAQAGTNWHDLVTNTLEQGYSGLENLALIPGKVGAAPIQNIGAYGVELADRFVSLSAINRVTGKVERFDLDQCQFGYRDSFFKSPAGADYCIWDVSLNLDKTFEMVLGHQGLLDLQDKSDELSAKGVFNEVCRIRRSKLPDPVDLGNAGSFFKNPVINMKQYGTLLQRFPNIVAYPLSGGQWKLAAAWLIDQLGLKGYRQGDAGVHTQQALVLVNHGKASGMEIAQLAKMIQQSVFESYGVMLQTEVNIVNESGRISLEDL